MLKSSLIFMVAFWVGSSAAYGQFYNQNGVVFGISPNGGVNVIGSESGYIWRKSSNNEWTQIAVQTVPAGLPTGTIFSIQDKELQQIPRINQLRAAQALADAYYASDMGNQLTSFDIGIVELFLEFPQELASAELIPQQTEDLGRVIEEYRSQLRAHGDNLDQEIDNQLRLAATGEIRKILLPQQFDFLKQFGKRRDMGVIRLLAQTPIGEMVGLSQQQKEKLNSKSDQIIERLKKQVEEARIELQEAYDDVLNDEQKKKVARISKDALEKQIAQSSPGNLIALHDLIDNETATKPLKESTPAEKKK